VTNFRLQVNCISRGKSAYEIALHTHQNATRYFKAQANAIELNLLIDTASHTFIDLNSIRPPIFPATTMSCGRAAFGRSLSRAILAEISLENARGNVISAFTGPYVPLGLPRLNGEFNPVDFAFNTTTLLDFQRNCVLIFGPSYGSIRDIIRDEVLVSRNPIPVLSDPSFGNIFRVMVRWNKGRHFEGLLDTGAQRTIFSNGVVKQHRIRRNVTLSDSAGNRRICHVVAGGFLEIGDAEVELDEVLVAPQQLQYPVILGMDVLSHFKLYLPTRWGKLAALCL